MTQQIPTPTTPVAQLIDQAICEALNNYDDDAIEKNIINPFLNGDKNNVTWEVFPDWSMVAEYPVLTATEEAKNSLDAMLNSLFVNRLSVVYWFKLENGLKTWEQLNDAEREQAFSVWSDTSRANGNYFCENDPLIEKIGLFLTHLGIDFELTYNHQKDQYSMTVKALGQFFDKKEVIPNNELIAQTIGLIASHNNDIHIAEFGVNVETGSNPNINLSTLLTSAINSLALKQKQYKYLEQTCRTMFYQYKNGAIYRLLDIELLREVP